MDPKFSSDRHTILVVEDEKPIRKLVTMILRRNGYEVFEAAGPKEAAVLWDQHRAEIELLFSDILMPTLTGPEMAREFLNTRPDLRIIFSTGNTNRVVAESADLAKHSMVLQKPYTPEQLLSAVKHAFEE